jgi:hypothetical protein
MLVTTYVTKTEQISKEIKLPYYSKEGRFATNYYRINEDESVLVAFTNTSNSYVSVELSTKDSGATHFGSALSGEPISEQEFLDVLQRAVNRMDTILSSLSKTEAI